MQEIHSIGGGRFFDGGGGGGGGDRRLRPHHHNNQQNQQALKCPRCDSLNTKFCYYNNYNLSQPRHFCKSCRRYWTKGGVLRNVPVGGGCRKSKRSKPKTSSSSETAVGAAPPPLPPSSTTRQPPSQDQHKSNSHSSSESSSLTAGATEAASVPSSNCELFNNQSSNPTFESGVMEQGGDSGIFSEIGSFTSMISSTSEALSFGFGNIPETSSFRFGGSTGTTQQGGMGNELLSGEWQAQQKEMEMSDMIPPQQELKLPEIMGGPLLDQTVPVDLSALQSKTENGGFGSLDWQGSADQGLFDLPNTVDHAYWSHAHWTDQDNSGLFHLP